MTNETEAVRAEPVAWRLRIGDSDMWGYTDSEADVDYYGNSSGLSYDKEPLYPASEIDRLTGEVERLRDELQKAKWESERHWALASGYQREMEAAERRLVDSESAPAVDTNSIQLLRQLRESYGNDPNKFTLERNALTAAIKALSRPEVGHDAS